MNAITIQVIACWFYLIVLQLSFSIFVTTNFLNRYALELNSEHMNQITMHPIGKINSPYKENKEIPIQGRFKDDVEANVELKKEYVKGLKDL